MCHFKTVLERILRLVENEERTHNLLLRHTGHPISHSKNTLIVEISDKL